MSSPLKLTRICIFCYKNSSSKSKERKISGDDDHSEAKKTVKRFLKIIQRYHRLAAGESGSGARHFRDGDDLRFSPVFGDDEAPFHEFLSSCSECVHILESFCDLYHEWKCTELRMKHSLECLGDAMVMGNRIPRRVKRLRGVCTKMEAKVATNGDYRLVPLKKGDIFKSVTDFRGVLTEKCTNRAESLPRVNLQKPAATVEPVDVLNIKLEPLEDTSSNNNYWETETGCSFIDDDIDTHIPEEVDMGPLRSKGDSLLETRNSNQEEDEALSRQLGMRRVYLCPNCPKTFSRMSAFKSHQKFHETREAAEVGLDSDVSEPENGDPDFIVEGMVGHEQQDEDSDISPSENRMFLNSDDDLDEDFVAEISEQDEEMDDDEVDDDDLYNQDPLDRRGDDQWEASERDNEHGPPPDFTFVSERKKKEMENREYLHCLEPNCSRRFLLPQELANHTKFHGEFACQSCSLIFDYAPTLALHEIEVHSDYDMKLKGRKAKVTKKRPRKFHCPYCRISRCNKQRVMKHYLEDHLGLPSSNVICETCQAGFFLPEESNEDLNLSARDRILDRHWTNFHNVKPDDSNVFKCDIDQCTVTFSTLMLLQRHRKWVHKVKDECNFCHKVFSDRKNLRKHLKVHRKQFVITCSEPSCKQRFATEDDMKFHFEAFHSANRNNRNVHQCPYPECGKILQNLFNYKLHLRSHDEKLMAEKHARNRANAKNWRLQNADEVKQKRRLAYKKAERPICEECGKSFSTNLVLKRHMLTHLGEDISKFYQFFCEQCGKGFISQYKLERHLITHSGVKPFQCNLCGEKCSYKATLKRHMKRKHKDHPIETDTGNSNSVVPDNPDALINDLINSMDTGTGNTVITTASVVPEAPINELENI